MGGEHLVGKDISPGVHRHWLLFFLHLFSLLFSPGFFFFLHMKIAASILFFGDFLKFLCLQTGGQVKMGGSTTLSLSRVRNSDIISWPLVCKQRASCQIVLLFKASHNNIKLVLQNRKITWVALLKGKKYRR